MKTPQFSQQDSNKDKSSFVKNFLKFKSKYEMKINFSI